jgi:hypothetical protein
VKVRGAMGEGARKPAELSLARPREDELEVDLTAHLGNARFVPLDASEGDLLLLDRREAGAVVDVDDAEARIEAEGEAGEACLGFEDPSGARAQSLSARMPGVSNPTGRPGVALSDNGRAAEPAALLISAQVSADGR